MRRLQRNDKIQLTLEVQSLLLKTQTPPGAERFDLAKPKPPIISRINVANGRTLFTPLRKSGYPVSAGFRHVVHGHFNRPLANSRSIFSISPDRLKSILQRPDVVRSPVNTLPGGKYVRVVNVGEVIGRTALKHGGVETSWIRIYTDSWGNLITVYPVPAP